MIKGQNIFQDIVPLFFLLISSFFDVLTRRVPNLFILLAGFFGLLLSIIPGSDVSFIEALFGFAVGFLIFFPQFVFGFIGGADLKIFSVTGLYLGPIEIINAFIFTLLCGGLLALIFLIYAKLKGLKLGGFKILRFENDDNELSNLRFSSEITLPYIVAIFFGVFIAITIK